MYTQGQLEQFAGDLEHMLGEENADVHQVIQEALSSNFSMDMEPLDHLPDPGPTCMFGHHEDTTPEKDFTATTHTSRQANLEVLSKYVKELSAFNTEDLMAALEDADMVEDDDKYEEDEEEDELSDDEESQKTHESEGEEDEDDIAILELAKKLRSQAVRHTAAKAKKKKMETEKKKKQQPSTGDRLEKMKFVISLLQGMTIKKNMRGLILNHALEQVHDQGDILRIIKGTRVKEVTRDRFLQEREVYANAQLDDVSGVAKKIKALSHNNK
jgi:hypothetical protein